MQVWIDPDTLKELRKSPGNVRQRLHRLALALGDEPRPAGSKALTPPDSWPAHLELRRLRVDSWRILYVIDAEWKLITILAIRKRPPYDYKDLQDLLDKLK